MAMEKPIILSVDGEAKALVERSKSGICIEPENIFEMKTAIGYLIKNPKKRMELGNNGREFVPKYYNRNEIIYKNKVLKCKKYKTYQM